MKKKGEWTIKETAQKFECEFFEVIEDMVIKPDGSDGAYQTIKMKPGVNVLPLDEEGNGRIRFEFAGLVGARQRQRWHANGDELYPLR